MDGKKEKTVDVQQPSRCTHVINISSTERIPQLVLCLMLFLCLPKCTSTLSTEGNHEKSQLSAHPQIHKHTNPQVQHINIHWEMPTLAQRQDHNQRTFWRAVWHENFEKLILKIEAIVSSQTFSDMFLVSSFTFVIDSFSWKKFCFGMTLESPSRAVSKNYFARPFSWIQPK